MREMIKDAAGAAPSYAVTTSSVLGYTFQDWVYIATFICTALHVYIMLRDKVFKRRK